MKWMVLIALVILGRAAVFGQTDLVVSDSVATDSVMIDLAIVEAFELAQADQSRDQYEAAKVQFDAIEKKDGVNEAYYDRLLVVARFFRDMDFVKELFKVSGKSKCGCGATCNKHHHHGHE